MSVPSEYFSYISIAICIILLAFIIIGFVKGFLYELVSILYTALSVAIAWFVSPILGNLYPIIALDNISDEYKLINNFINLNPLLNTLAYFLIVFLILKVFYWILVLLLKGMNKIPVLGKINKILGAIAGIFNGLLVCLAINMLLTLPLFKNGKDIINGTVLKYTNNLNSIVFKYIANNVDLNNLQVQFNNFDVDDARQDFMNWLNNSDE